MQDVCAAQTPEAARVQVSAISQKVWTVLLPRMLDYYRKSEVMELNIGSILWLSVVFLYKSHSKFNKISCKFFFGVL